MKNSREELNTYKGWQNQGYQVKRNQRSTYMKNDRPLFSRSQVVKRNTENRAHCHSKKVEQSETNAISGIISVIIGLIVLVYWYLN